MLSRASIEDRIAGLTDLLKVPPLANKIDAANQIRRARKQQRDVAERNLATVSRRIGRVMPDDEPAELVAARSALKDAENALARAVGAKTKARDDADAAFQAASLAAITEAGPALSDLVDLITEPVNALVDWHALALRNQFDAPLLREVPAIQDGLRALQALVNAVSASHMVDADDGVAQ